MLPLRNACFPLAQSMASPQAASHPFITGQPHPRDLGALTIAADPLIEKRFSNQMQRKLQQQKDQQDAERKHAQRLRHQVRFWVRAKSDGTFFLTAGGRGEGGRGGGYWHAVSVKNREMGQRMERRISGWACVSIVVS